ncbi:unnamed protein product [Caenorhabditis brenneri]
MANPSNTGPMDTVIDEFSSKTASSVEQETTVQQHAEATEQIVEETDIDVPTSSPPSSNSHKRKSDNVEESTSKRSNMQDEDSDESDSDMKLNWFTAKCIEYCYHKHKHSLSEEEAAMFERMFQNFQESGVSPSVAYSDDDDYSNLKGILEAAMKSTPNDSQKAKNPPKSSSKTPLHCFTCTRQTITDDLNGDKILEHSRNWIQTGDNSVFNTFPLPKKNDKNRINGAFFSKKGFTLNRSDANSLLLPVVVIEVNEGFNVKELESQMKSLSTCIVRGLGKASGMKFEEFDLELLSNIDPEQKITTIRQRPQRFTTNYNMLQEEREDGGKQWKMDSVSETNKRTLKEYAENYSKIKRKVDAAFSEMRANPGKIDGIVKTLKEELIAVQFPIISERPKAVNPRIPIVSFGSNVDIGSDPKFQKQLEEIHKLPLFLQYNIGLMNSVDYGIAGINRVQVYYKTPGSRTSVHIENQALLSVNLNIGPGNCIWICVTMTEMAKYEDFLNSNGIFPYETVFWPSEEVLIKLGIKYRKIVQHPDDLVFVGVGTIHWVQADNFCANVSWNIFDADVMQLRAAALIYDHNRFHSYNSVVPLTTILWSITKSKAYEGTELATEIKRLLASSLAYSQFEVDLAHLKGYEIRNVDDAQFAVPSVILCTNLFCSRNSLYNLFVVVNDVDGNWQTMCINCVNKKTKNSEHVVYIRHSMQKLQEIFDSYNNAVN